MNRRKLLGIAAGAVGASLLPGRLWALPGAGWPSAAAWAGLNRRTGGTLRKLESPFVACRRAPQSAACTKLFENVKNPYFVGNDPALTQTLGWVDAWTSQTSAYAVAARNAGDVAAAVDFAREHGLRLVVKGGGHSYQGTSNAADSLLIWTRHMDEIEMHDAFVAQGCSAPPQPAVTIGAGAIWNHAYDAVTTKAGKYVQGGGCTTVGVAGLIQSGGFGSFSKHYGTAAAGLLEAEVVTADGRVRVANACSNPELFWALKGGGGGSFGVVTKVTVRVRELPEFFGAVQFQVKAASDEAYRSLVAAFVEHYRKALFNDAWGEQAEFRPDNVLDVHMVSYGLATAEAKAVWQPFFDWVRQRSAQYTLAGEPLVASAPAAHWWDSAFYAKYAPGVIVENAGAGAKPGEYWWAGDGEQAGWVINGYESVWMPASLLDDADGLARTLYDASRHWGFSLHFNKGLAGAPAAEIAAALDTATNPAVTQAFALMIAGDGQQPAYPGVAGHEPDVAAGRRSAQRIRACGDRFRAAVPNAGSYVSESDYFLERWQQAFWGSNYARLAAAKRTYDPSGVFTVHHGAGSPA